MSTNLCFIIDEEWSSAVVFFIEFLNVAKRGVRRREEEMENWSDVYGQCVDHSEWRKLLCYGCQRPHMVDRWFRNILMQTHTVQLEVELKCFLDMENADIYSNLYWYIYIYFTSYWCLLVNWFLESFYKYTRGTFTKENACDCWVHWCWLAWFLIF